MRSPAEFKRLLVGRRIEDVRRRAKYLLFDLDSGEILVVHLGMSGQLLLRPAAAEVPRHARIGFSLEGGSVLYANDPRKFGEAYVYSEPAGRTAVDPFRLGPEPLSPTWSRENLARALAGRTAPIKALLLNQTLVAGLGNIYTDEALFRARIHPLVPGGNLDGARVRALHGAVRRVLREAIAHQGTSAADRQYVDGEGRLGRFQNRLRVYQRRGLPCPACSAPILTLKTGGRTAHFCPRCQREPR